MPIIVLILIAILLLFVLSTVINVTTGLIVPILIWAFTGWAAGKLVKGRGNGALVDILFGLVGGIVGGLIFGILGFSSGGLIGSILSGIVGAVIVIYLVRAFARR